MRHLDDEEFLRVKWNIDWGWLCRGMAGPLVVCEVGIGPRDLSILPYFAGRPDVKCIGIEPLPVFCEWARTLPNTTIHECAVARHRGKVTLVDNYGSSYAEGAWAPTPAPDNRKIEVAAVPFGDLDPGNIDILNVDCEGAERLVLEKMKSRPAVLGIECWPGSPDACWIHGWLCARGYTCRLTTGPEGEGMVWSL